MMFQDPEPTPFDLRWTMLGVPIRVHPLFWVLAAFLGWHWLQEYGAVYLAMWMGCVFVSVLLHEFGHVLAGQSFGSRGRILLFWDGGLAIGSTNLSSRWQRIAVLLAGPAVQLLLYVLLYFGVSRSQLQALPAGWLIPAVHCLSMLLLINLYWPIINLLPIWPLDGGQISRELFDVVLPGRGPSIALLLSMLLSGGLAILLLMAANKQIPQIPYLYGTTYNAMLFAILCVSSYQAWQGEQTRRRWDDRLPWER